MKKYVYRFICAAIMTLLAVVAFAYVWLRFVGRNNQTGHLLGYGNILMSIGLYSFVFILFGRWLHAFKVGVERKAKIISGVVLTTCLTNTVEIFLSMAITGQFRFFVAFSWRYLVLSLVQSVVLSLLASQMVDYYRKVIPPIELLEITGDHKNKLTKSINNIKYKYQIKKIISYNISENELRAEIDKHEAILINDIPANMENDIVKFCFEKNKRVYITPKISDIILKASENLNLVDTPLFLCRNQLINPYQRIIKRAFDVFVSLLALVLVSPLFLITALAIKFEDHGPVFFRQERVTKDGKRFMILKFRSMIVDAEKDGRPHPAGEKDDRITKVGNIIRAYRIDELPQLWNIFVGDMSIVGPRPERVEHVDKYMSEISEFDFRHKVKGGLTGYAQVYGKYNTSALDKLKLDLIYITNYSFIMDIQIIFETIKILFIQDSTEGFDEEMIAEMHREKSL